MPALDKITRGQVRRLAVIAHHQVAFLFQQRLRNRHKRQRAVANVFRERGGAGVRRQVDDARHALLLKREQGTLKMFAVIQRLTEKHHITLLLQLLNDARHHLDGKAVAEVAQDQAD